MQTVLDARRQYQAILDGPQQAKAFMPSRVRIEDRSPKRWSRPTKRHINNLLTSECFRLQALLHALVTHTCSSVSAVARFPSLVQDIPSILAWSARPRTFSPYAGPNFARPMLWKVIIASHRSLCGTHILTSRDNSHLESPLSQCRYVST
jgi:hypothetical protein